MPVYYFQSSSSLSLRGSKFQNNSLGNILLFFNFYAMEYSKSTGMAKKVWRNYLLITSPSQMCVKYSKGSGTYSENNQFSDKIRVTAHGSRMVQLLLTRLLCSLCEVYKQKVWYFCFCFSVGINEVIEAVNPMALGQLQ